jgi:hypothetical protein
VAKIAKNALKESLRTNLCFRKFFLDFVGFFSRVILAIKKAFFFVVLKKIPIFAKILYAYREEKGLF